MNEHLYITSPIDDLVRLYVGSNGPYTDKLPEGYVYQERLYGEVHGWCGGVLCSECPVVDYCDGHDETFFDTYFPNFKTNYPELLI